MASPKARKVKIAILVCDTPLPVIIERYGDYTKLFTNLLEEGCSSLNTKLVAGNQRTLELEISSFDVVEQKYPRDYQEFDAYLLTGSKYSAYEQLPWLEELRTFIRKVDSKPQIRLLGICFGHQIIADALGGKVEKNPKGWEVGPTQIKLKSPGLPFSTILDNTASMCMQQMHQDHVTKMPEGFINIASSNKCGIQIMAKMNKALCIQGHPEFTGGLVRELVNVRMANGVFSKDLGEDALKVMDDVCDSGLYTECMLRFLLEPIQ